MSTVFGALALVCADEPVSQIVIDYIFGVQQPDGGWSSGWNRGILHLYPDDFQLLDLYPAESNLNI